MKVKKMSKSFLKLIQDQVLRMQLEMMCAPIGSGQRRVIMEDLRELKKTLSTGMVSVS
jgi:hypothetical protein